MNSSGQPVQKGDIIRDLKLCATYKRLAERPQDLWEGDLAQDIEADIRDQRGIVEASDIRNYRPIWKVQYSIRHQLASHVFNMYIKSNLRVQNQLTL